MKQSNIYRNILDKSSGEQGNSVSQAGQDFNIVTNPMLEQFRFLQNTYEEWKEVIEEDESIDERKDKLRVAEESLGEDYSEEAVHELLSEFQDRDSSFEDPSQDIFASAVINRIGGENVSIEADVLSGLNGLMGLGYRNKGNVAIKGEVDESIFKENMAGNVSIEGEVDGAVGKEMRGGTIKINGDTGGMYGVGHQMQGGRIIVDGYAEKAGRNMEGGEVGSEQSVETLAKSAEDGIAWVNDDAEEVGNYAKGGLIYVAGDAEEIGERSRDGEIYIEGEIGNIGERCGADIYQWRDGEWELVHEGEDWGASSRSKKKNTTSAQTTSHKSKQTMEHQDSYEELEEMNKILEYDDEDYLIDDEDFGFYQEESYETETKEAQPELAEKVGKLDALSEKSIEEQLRDEE